MEKNTNTKIVNESELLKKRLFDISLEEIKTSMKKVDVQLQKIKRGVGSNQTVYYRATLIFIPGTYELNLNLTQMEYNQICLKRNPGSVSIPDSIKLKAYFLNVEYENVNQVTSIKRTSYQLKIILSDLVRKKIWLNQLEQAMWEQLVKVPFIKAERDADEELDEEDAI